MRKILLTIFLGLTFLSIQAQVQNRNQNQNQQLNQNQNRSQNFDLFGGDSTKLSKFVGITFDGPTHYTDYKIFNIHNDTTLVDTTLTIKKHHKFNYLRKDDFELIAFHNQGQTFNRLAYDFNTIPLFPKMGMRSKFYDYLTVEEVPFYYLPTPTSEIMYRTGLEQGQVLDAMLTLNTSRQFNVSIGYKGLRSLGKYRHALASHGSFSATFNYQNKKNTYLLRGHFFSFDFLNSENGGLIEESVAYFEANDPNYIDRARLDVAYINAENMLEGKRYYLDQRLKLFSKKNKLRREDEARKIVRANDSIANLLRLYKLDSVARKKEELKTLKVNDSIAALQIQKPDSIISRDSIALIKQVPLIKKDSIGEGIPVFNDSISKPDTLLVDVPVKLDSLDINAIRSRDSIALIETRKTDSIAKLIALKKWDSVKRVRMREIAGKLKLESDSIKKIRDSLNLDTIVKPLLKTPIFELAFGHTLTYETKHYRFSQDAAHASFGETYGGAIKDHTSFQTTEHEAYLFMNSLVTGRLRAKARAFNYNYHYNSILYLDDITIADKLKSNVLAIGADWKKKIGNLHFEADINSILSGDLSGNNLRAGVTYKKDSIYKVKGFAQIASKSPNYNMLLFQSNYKLFNWQNDFKNEEIKNVGLEFSSKKWGSLSASYNIIDNYTYFNDVSAPVQAKETLNYIKVKASKSIRYRKFTLENTVMYQTVSEGASFFRVPEVVTRNSLYFSSHLFRGRPLYLQTGVTFKYFTLFKANAYNPLISEFVLQDQMDIGNYPVLDFFINAQIQRTRLYLKAENFSGGFTGRNYYAAPFYPIRDFTVRFGLVWNFFI